MQSFRHRLLMAIFLISCALAYALFSEPDGIPALNYHQINDRDENSLTITSHQFIAQMDYLKKSGYHTITAGELADALEKGSPLPEKPILLTFDDGYSDNYHVAYPILKERNMKAIIFIITDYVDQYPNYLTWDNIREMQQNHIEFGSHTLNHAELTHIPPDDIKKQLVNSKAALEWRLSSPIEFLAYPCGFRNPAIMEQVKAAGYRAAFTVDLGRILPDDNLYELHRIPIFGGNHHELLRFKARLRCPRLAASLENLQDAIRAAGYPTLANLVPVI